MVLHHNIFEEFYVPLEIVFGGMILILAFFADHFRKKAKKLKKYEGILKIDDEVQKLSLQKSKAIAIIEKLKKANEELKHLHNIYNEGAELISFGFYTPKYDFKDSEKYKKKLDEIRSKQKNAIKGESAIVCSTAWEVDGSKKKGKQLAKKIIKLGLNAYNVQCDNAILKVSHSNIKQSEARLDKIRENIDKLLAGYHCTVDTQFHQLKRMELNLAFEYQEKAYAEKEEQRQIKEQMREEEKVAREIEKAQREAEKEEKNYEKALEKARAELEMKSDEEKSAFAEKIAELERQLQEAHEKKDRAISQAQQTKRGHVYVISNVGSFGEHVYKIGMTRRLDPMDRVKELGDASVPFSFDVHAMIFSDNAPELEKKLHDKFTTNRINQINHRKEFFRANLAEVKAQCEELGAKVEFTMIAEAQEYRDTLAMAQKENQEKPVDTVDELETLLKAS